MKNFTILTWRFSALMLPVALTAIGSAQSGPSESDFATRCAQAGVVRCVGFDSNTDIQGGYGSNSGVFASSGNANIRPTLDASVRASGNSSLKFTIPSRSGADTSGSYFANFSPDLSAQFGENSDFYIQWRQRFTPEFVATEYAGGEGWKQTIIGTGDKPGGVLYFSCTDLEVVTVNGYYRGFTQMYNSCSGSASHGAYDGFEEPFGSFDFKLQNARPAPYCLYSQTHTTPSTAFPPSGNCIGYFPNEWMTFQVHVRTGPRVGDEFINSFVELWIAREGQPSELAIAWGPYNLSAGSPGENQKFGKVWFLPYNTRKDSSVAYPETFVWYDELIISRTRIADPVTSSGGDPGDTAPPSTPTGLQATPAPRQITVSWNASTDNVGVTGYHIFRGATQVGTSTTTSFVDTGLAAATPYSYSVAAIDAAGNISARSTSVSATTPPDPDTTPPSVPTGLQATAAPGQIALSWTASSDNTGVTAYRIFRGGTQVGTSTTTSLVNTGLAPATTYSYAVAAVDAAGNVSAQSTTASATTPGAASGSGPVAAYSFNDGSGSTLLDRSGQGNQGTLRNGPLWTTGKYSGGLTFDGANDYVTVPNSAAVNIAGRAITVELWVNSRTGGSTTDYVILNKPWFTSVMSPPYYQYGLEFQGTNRDFVFFLGTASGVHEYRMAAGSSYGTWYHVAFTYDGANVKGYLDGALRLTRPETLSIVARGRDLRFGVDGGFGQPFKGVLDDVRIYSRALTQAEVQRDMNTPVSDGTSPPPSPPPPADTQAPSIPMGLTASALSSSQVNVSWSASTDNIGVTGYRVSRCQGSTCIPGTQIATVTGTSYQDTGLSSATAYTYRVAAHDAAGNVSAPSSTASATTQAASPSPPPSGTSLATLAASLQPGQWGELTTVNITATLDNLDGASGMLPVYTDDLVWDPGGQQAFLIGADHLAPQGPQFVSYRAANNTWQRLPRPAWLSSLTFFHGYDHSAIDAGRRLVYHRPYAQNVVHRYDIASQTWTQLPAAALVNTYQNCCDALEFFPELDGVVWVRGAVGEVWLFRENGQQWSQLGTWPTQDGGTWTFAEYNPVHRVLVFGSGNSNTLFKLSSSGQITQLRNPPVSVYDGSGYVGVFTADPVSGSYLLLTPTSRQFYSYDVSTDSWQLRSSPTKPDLSSKGVAATPVSSYGVNLLVSCTRGECHAYVYKHSSPP